MCPPASAEFNLLNKLFMFFPYIQSGKAALRHMDLEYVVRLCALQEEEETLWDSYDSLSVMHEKNNNRGLGYADYRETARGEKQLTEEEWTYRVELEPVSK